MSELGWIELDPPTWEFPPPELPAYIYNFDRECAELYVSGFGAPVGAGNPREPESAAPLLTGRAAPPGFLGGHTGRDPRERRKLHLSVMID